MKIRSKRHVKTIATAGCCTLAVCLVGAVAASSASAALPELGRCLPVEKVAEGKKSSYHGLYTNKGCTMLNSKTKGKYEWTPGPGADTAVEAEISEPVLETTGGAKVECSFAVLNGGEITGPKTEKFSSITFSACAPGGTAGDKFCETAPEKGNSIEDLTEVTAELGPVSGGAKPMAGWDLKGVKMAYTCGPADEVESIQLVEGSVIDNLKRHSTNVMSTSTEATYKEVMGKQLPEAFEGGTADTLKTTTVAGVSTSEEQTGLSASERETYGEPLEIRTKE